MNRFLILVLLALVGPSHGFQVPRAITTSSRPSLSPLKMMPLESHHFMDTVSTLLADASDSIPAPGEVTYSRASYYTILGLYVLSLPGLWSTIKRSTKAKVKRKTFVT